MNNDNKSEGRADWVLFLTFLIKRFRNSFQCETQALFINKTFGICDEGAERVVIFYLSVAGIFQQYNISALFDISYTKEQ